jgi:hypothetical protein
MTTFYPERLPDDDLFSVAQLCRAEELAKADPASLTDRQINMTATYAFDDAIVIARKRDAARAQAAAPRPVVPPVVRRRCVDAPRGDLGVD